MPISCVRLCPLLWPLVSPSFFGKFGYGHYWTVFILSTSTLGEGEFEIILGGDKVCLRWQAKKIILIFFPLQVTWQARQGHHPYIFSSPNQLTSKKRNPYNFLSSVTLFDNISIWGGEEFPFPSQNIKQFWGEFLTFGEIPPQIRPRINTGIWR